MFYELQPHEQQRSHAKLLSSLNRTCDQDTQAQSNLGPIQYMKRYYEVDNSLTKLARLIQYYDYDDKSKRFINSEATNFLLKNHVEEKRHGHLEDSENSGNFNFYRGNVLSQSIFYSGKASSDTSLITGFLGNLKKSGDKNFSGNLKNEQTQMISLNYIPYRSKKRVSKVDGLKFQKQLASLQKKWASSSKYLKKLIN